MWNCIIFAFSHGSCAFPSFSYAVLFFIRVPFIHSFTTTFLVYSRLSLVVGTRPGRGRRLSSNSCVHTYSWSFLKPFAVIPVKRVFSANLLKIRLFPCEVKIWNCKLKETLSCCQELLLLLLYLYHPWAILCPPFCSIFFFRRCCCFE